MYDNYENPIDQNRNENEQYSDHSSMYRERQSGSEPGPSLQQRSSRKKKKGMPKFVKLVASALVFGLIAGVTFQSVNLVTNRIVNTGSSSSSVSTTSSGVSLQQTSVLTSTGTYLQESDVSTVVENAMPSIVAITNSSVQEVQDYFGGYSQQEVTGAGSGFIVGENESELLIATNYHVIDGATTLTVTFADDASAEALMKGGNAERDIAVLAVSISDLSDETLSSIKIATLGDSDSVKVGQTAIAIGNALGYGQSVTSGIISARNVSFDETVDLNGEFIQTDAAINPGNSGGALLNAAGEVIGINTAKLSSDGTSTSASVEAMGYAIPISDVIDMINEYMNSETREQLDEDERGYLGIRVQTVDETTAAAYNMPTGVYVTEVTEDSAADQAGIKQGDVITAVNGNSVTSAGYMISQLSYYAPGEEVTLTVQRAGRNGEYDEKTIEVTLEKAQ